MTHKVICKDERPRYSLTTFLLAPNNRNVEVGKEFVDSEHPPKFLPYKFETYVATRVTTGLMAGQALDLLRNPQLLRNKPLNNPSHDEWKCTWFQLLYVILPCLFDFSYCTWFYCVCLISVIVRDFYIMESLVGRKVYTSTSLGHLTL